MTYTKPTITDLGSVRDLTLAGSINKVGDKSDFYSKNTPLVGSIVPAPGASGR